MATRDAFEYVQDTAGDTLRVFATYEDHEYTIPYARSDVEKRYSETELKQWVRELQENLCRARGLEDKLGEQYAGLRLFPRIILVHFPPSDDEERGLILSLDREAGRNLSEFLESTTVLWRDGFLDFGDEN